MSISEGLETLREIVRGGPARQVWAGPEGDVYELKRRALWFVTANRWVDSTRFEILRGVLRLSNTAILFYSENPIQDRMSGGWSPAGASQWTVNLDGLDVLELERWLYMGDWILCAPAPNRCRVDISAQLDLWNPPSGLQWPYSERMSVVVQAEKDDDPWRIWLARRG